MKYIARVLVFLSSLFLLAYSSSQFALAASYDVSASVAFPPPTQAATIDPLLNNITVSNAAFVISGTCEVLTPPGVITVLRGATLLGSQSCVSGSYSLQIVLAEGVNTLIVRSASVSSLYGPDSSPVTITLNTPAAPIPTTPQTSSPAPTTPGATNLTPADNNAFNAGTSSGLSIAPQDPFTVMSPSNQVSLSFRIDGGSTPYTIELNWGDGTTETKTIDKPGDYTFTHQYRNAGNYTVKGRLRDVLGAVTEISHAVVVAKPTDQTIKPSSTEASPPNNSVVSWVTQHWVATSVGVAAVGVAGAAYWLGQSAAIHTAATSGAGQSQTKSLRKTPKPKPNTKGKK